MFVECIKKFCNFILQATFMMSEGMMLTVTGGSLGLTPPYISYFLDYFPRVLLISDHTCHRVQYEGGNKMRVGLINLSLVRCVLQSHTRHRSAHDWCLCTAQILGTYSAVQCVSTDWLGQVIWVVQVVLIASNVCGCVKPCGNYLKGEVNLQIKRAGARRSGKKIKEIRHSSPV